MVSVLVSVVMVAGGLAQVPSQPTNAADPLVETATQFYLRYRAAVASARSIDEVVALWAAEAADEYRSTPTDQRVDLAGIKRVNDMVSNVTVTGEAVSVGAGTPEATVSLEGIGKDQKKVTGTAHLVKQKGEWKLVGPEEWK